MSSSITRSLSNRAPTRAEITDRAAREIIEAETAARRQQTDRLRSARLKMEAAARESRKAEPAPPKRGRAR